MIAGPRQAGKSTLAKQLREHGHPVTFESLDVATTRAAATRDPDGFLQQLQYPVVIDEVQKAPELFSAIKASVDRERTPGKFILTGSANVLLLPKISESLAGRIEILTLWPLSQGELRDSVDTFVARAFGPRETLSGGPLTREDLIERLLKGGFPEAVERADRRRADWFDAYLSTVIERDIRDLADIERADTLPDLLALLAVRVKAPLNMSRLSSELKISDATIRRYLAILERIYITQRISAYTRSIDRQVTKAPKLLLCDSGLLGHLLELDRSRLARNDSMLGLLLENFVGTELIRQIGWNRPQMGLRYLRASRGEEIDFLITRRDGSVIAIEVKAAATVRDEDFKHLRSLQERLSERFVRGLVIYTGDGVAAFGDGLEAVPVSALWH